MMRTRTTSAKTPTTARPALKAEDRERRQAERDTELADDHPAAAAAENGRTAARHAIDDRRPQEFQRVGEPDP